MQLDTSNTMPATMAEENLSKKAVMMQVTLRQMIETSSDSDSDSDGVDIC